MFEIARDTRTLICIGTGGVGKTTMAASIAVGEAQNGKRVLVLTIDPSQRLAQALGVKRDGQVHRVQLPPDNNNNGGELWSCVIDPQLSFETFIRNAAGNNVDIESLLKNKLYHQLSTRLNGSQEFTSLISLYDYSVSQKYDLIILDTPPAQHTWNFLHAPEKISALFNDGIASWFRQKDEEIGFLKKIFNVGTGQVLRALQLLTGSVFMSELSAFFRAIQSWQEPLSRYMSKCQSLLTSNETEFVLVTALDASRLNESRKLALEIQKQGYRLTSVIVNRVPDWALEQEKNDIASKRLQSLINYFNELILKMRDSLTQLKKSLIVYKCPELSQDTYDVKALLENYEHVSKLD
jgi:anion-transporting  ArsA/GET3 family ATPase